MKYNVEYLWLILRDHTLFSRKGDVKHVKVVFYG